MGAKHAIYNRLLIDYIYFTPPKINIVKLDLNVKLLVINDTFISN